MDSRIDIPSRYALTFGQQRENTRATSQAVIEELKERYPLQWPHLIGVLLFHREACMLAALRALEAAFDDPKMTRVGLRRKMVAVLAAIAERGPEALMPKSGQE